MAIQLAAGIAEADFAWTIGSLCQINRIPFDPALLLQKFPAPHSVRQLIEALRSFGFRTGEGKLAKSVFPCLGFLTGEAVKPALLIKRDAERLLYFVAGSQTPQTAPATTIKEQFDADVLLLRHESAREPAAEDGAPVASKFGFRWFWAELLRHKRIWRDVLAASLALQLAGLARLSFLSWHAGYVPLANAAQVAHATVRFRPGADVGSESILGVLPIEIHGEVNNPRSGTITRGKYGGRAVPRP